MVDPFPSDPMNGSLSTTIQSNARELEATAQAVLFLYETTQHVDTSEAILNSYHCLQTALSQLKIAGAEDRKARRDKVVGPMSPETPFGPRHTTKDVTKERIAQLRVDAEKPENTQIRSSHLMEAQALESGDLVASWRTTACLSEKELNALSGTKLTPEATYLAVIHLKDLEKAVIDAIPVLERAKDLARRICGDGFCVDARAIERVLAVVRPSTVEQKPA